MLITAGATLCGQDRKGIIHAVAKDTVTAHFRGRRLREHRRRTVDGVCGKRFLRFVAGDAVDQQGAYIDKIASVWPPRLATLHEHGRDRCRECWEATGRPRPDPHSWPAS